MPLNFIIYNSAVALLLCHFPSSPSPLSPQITISTENSDILMVWNLYPHLLALLPPLRKVNYLGMRFKSQCIPQQPTIGLHPQPSLRQLFSHRLMTRLWTQPQQLLYRRDTTCAYRGANVAYPVHSKSGVSWKRWQKKSRFKRAFNTQRSCESYSPKRSFISRADHIV